MLGTAKLAQMAEEVAALRAALDAQIAQSSLAEEGLQASRERVEQLESMHREAGECLSAEVSQLREKIDAIDRNIDPEPMQALENRILRLEKRLDQQAEDMQGAVAGLIARIDGAKPARKSS